MRKNIVIFLVLFNLPLFIFSQGVPQLLVANVPMEDSVHLATDIYLPSSQGKFPTILYLLPYDRRTRERQQFCQFLVSRGYAVVIQNPRGKFGSQGKYLPFIDELKDFEQTLEWVLNQGWCSGEIGIFGSSSSSYNAQLLASTQNPSIKAIINHSGLTDIDQLFFPGGAFRLNTMFPWLNYFYLEKRVPWDQWDDIFKKAPLAEQMEWDTYLLHQMARKSVATHRVKVPVMHITGWNDIVYRQSFFLYEDIKHFNASVPQHMMVGPWEHNYNHSQTSFGDVDFGPESILSYRDFRINIANWFDRYLKGINVPVGQHQFFIMGMNKWVYVPTFPIQEAQAHIFFLDAENQMIDSLPSSENTYSYIFDPEDPVPTFGGVNSHLFPKESGPRDQTRFIEREDVISFQTDTLSEELYILGEMKVVLFASSDVPDTDFTAKLMVQQTDGVLRIIEDGIIRASNRNSRLSKEWLEKDEVYRFEIDLGYTGIELKPKERLVLHISSSNFPKYNVNHNFKKDPLEAMDFQKANQTIYTGGEHSSYLSITTVPKEFIQQHVKF